MKRVLPENRSCVVTVCLAVAMLAASTANVMVESASNAGWFGPGAFTDRSCWDIPPVVCTALFFMGLCALVQIRAAFRQLRHPANGIVRIASDFLAGSIFRSAATIFATQLLVLSGMETSEQIVIYGHTLGGMVWLGGPVGIALTVHAVVCLTIICVTAAALHHISDLARHVVQLLNVLILPRTRDRQPFYISARLALSEGHTTRVCCRIGERAPPVVLA
jgi:hypothetical protein